MRWFLFMIVTASFHSGDGVNKLSGLEQFWTDDYKVFEQIYGKTSDRDIYGVSLPPSIKQGILKTDASVIKESFEPSFNKDLYDTENGNNEFIKNKPRSTFNFIKYDKFKPISQDNDPETYNYLKHLEEVSKDHEKFPTPKGGLKPNYDIDPKKTEAYQSIQDILDAHEEKKEKEREIDNKGEKRGKKPIRIRNSNVSKRCVSGRCRRNPVRGISRPYVRRIKHKYVY